MPETFKDKIRGHDQDFLETKPNETIRLEDNSMIKNFEVDFDEEEEVTWAGGIKGIRALRM